MAFIKYGEGDVVATQLNIHKNKFIERVFAKIDQDITERFAKQSEMDM